MLFIQNLDEINTGNALQSDQADEQDNVTIVITLISQLSIAT